MTAAPLWSPSPNCDARDAAIDMVVIHYTDMKSAEAALAWLTAPESFVSAHYLIAADGTVAQLVKEADRAWHAGISYWQGIRDNNARSIGIELDSAGHRGGAAPVFPSAQIDALLRLLDGIRTRHAVPAHNVVAHSDIAPHRKIDPGEAFPWARLADAGHALEPAAAPTPEPAFCAPAFAQALSAIGYAPALARIDDVFPQPPAPRTARTLPAGANPAPAILPSAADGTLWQPVCDAFHRRFLADRLGQAPDARALTLAEALAREVAGSA